MQHTPKYFSMKKIFKTLIISGSMVFIVQCGKDDEKAAVTSSFAAVYATLSSDNALCTSCHAPTLEADVAGANLVYTTQAEAYEDLTGKTSTAPGCTSIKLVAGGAPADSYLLAVLFDDYRADIGCSTITSHDLRLTTARDILDAEKATFVNWISAGAAQ
ncbi:MAG: hypothetical protein KBD78_13935 [Oligoflexales bacterium]|nr:hypothetical protein [Oligoflexales bacterium]